MTDLLLITPPTRLGIYQGLTDEFAAIEPPVWAGLIATYIRNKGYTVQMLDCEAEGLSIEEATQRIVGIEPDLAVFCVYGQQPSASTQCMMGGRELCKSLNATKKLIPTLVLGTHASALPEKTAREEPYDLVCYGEGPLTIEAILKFYQHQIKWEEIPGIAYVKGEYKKHLSAPKIKDLDIELPSQAWDLLPMDKYIAHNWHCLDHIEERRPYVSIQTSLGCPFQCSFCCINAPFGGPGVRYWSVENTLKQIDDAVSRFGVKNIKFPDEMFVLNEKHVLGICDGLIERNYDLNIWAYTRVDTMKDKFLEKMRKAGFRWLVVGIESGSKHVRDGVEKGRFGDSDIEISVKKIMDSGIYVMGNYIFGLPDDTLESMNETLKLSMKLKTQWANFYSAMAYPGSPLYSLAIQDGLQLPSDWSGYSQHAYETLPLPTNHLTGPEVLAFRDRAFQTYYTDPEYLERIEKTFGLKARTHIEKMVKLPLKRKFVA